MSGKIGCCQGIFPTLASVLPGYALESRLAAFVKSFGRRKAYESPRRTNPRGPERELWRFEIYACAGERLSGAFDASWLDLDREISGQIGRAEASLAGGLVVDRSVMDDGRASGRWPQ